MRLKSELYAKEQTEIVDTIISILSLDRENSTTLYELEHDENKKKQLIDLIPTIRKYFSFSGCWGVSEPSKLQRPWLSIIRIITKNFYNMYSCDYTLKQGEKRVRTKRYIFTKTI